MTRTRSKVLLVDDDPATRLGLAEFFTEAGFDVQAVGSFEEGLRALRSGAPDFLIADVRLGAFNGLQLLVSSPHQIPAIIITGFADPVLESDARQHGAEYVLKPVSPHVLLEMVERRLRALEGSQFQTLRRWDRKPVPGGLEARIGDRPARILDISYGGLRFEIPRSDTDLPASLSLRVSTSDFSIRADIVWRTSIGSEILMCGAQVSQSSPAVAREWRGLVDAVA
jgi:DNA-binding response OmpR family regulator